MVLSPKLVLLFVLAIEVTSPELWISTSPSGVEMCKKQCERRGNCFKLCYDASRLQCMDCGTRPSGLAVFPRIKMSSTCHENHVQVVSRKGRSLCLKEGRRSDGAHQVDDEGKPRKPQECILHIQGLKLDIDTSTVDATMSYINIAGNNGISNRKVVSRFRRPPRAVGMVPSGGLFTKLLQQNNLYYFSLRINLHVIKKEKQAQYALTFGIVTENDTTVSLSALKTRKTFAGFSVAYVHNIHGIVTSGLNNKFGTLFEIDNNGSTVVTFYLDLSKGIMCLLRSGSSGMRCEDGLPKEPPRRAVVFLTPRFDDLAVSVVPVCPEQSQSGREFITSKSLLGREHCADKPVLKLRCGDANAWLKTDPH